MAIIVAIEFTTPGFKRGSLFGMGTHNISVLRLGFLTVCKVNDTFPVREFLSFMDANVSMPFYLAGKSKEFREKSRKDMHRARAALAQEKEAEIERWRKSYREKCNECYDIQSRLHKSESALRVITNLSENKNEL